MSRLVIPSMCLIMLLTPGSVGSAQSPNDMWTSLGPHGMPVCALAIDRSNPKTIYVVADYQGIFKTTNGGASWTMLKVDKRPNASVTIRAIAIDRFNTNIIYAGALDHLYKTTNAGAEWD